MTPIAALCAYAVISIAMIGFQIMYTYATQGFGFGFSANRPAVPLSAFGVRVGRAVQNQTESAAYIVPVLVAAQFLSLTDSTTSTLLLLIVLGRAAFAILYYTGIPFVRVPAFVCGTMPSLYLAVVMLMTAAA